MREEYVSDSTSYKSSDRPWWEQFKIDELNRIIDEALEQNWDTKSAAFRLEQAIATSNAAIAKTWPELSFDSGLEVSKGRGQKRATSSDANLDLSWDVDIFKRLSSSQARDNFLAKARWWELQAIRLTISTEVSEAYLDYIAETLLLDLLADQETAASSFLSLVEVRYEQGLTTEIDVLQQRGQVADIRSVIPRTLARKGIAKLRIEALLGKLPGSWQASNIPALPPIKGTVVSELNQIALLNQRPDLLQLQNLVASADADVGRALAERLPRLTLQLESSWNDTTSSFNPINTLAAGLAGPIFDFGARKQESLRTQAVVKARLAEFTQAYIEAVETTRRVILQLSSQEKLLAILKEQDQLLERILNQAQLRYKQGLTDYLPVLTTQQTLYRLQQRIIVEKRLYYTYKIAFYRALGGPIPYTTDKAAM
jgi:outer membrane protein TolC